LRPSFICLHPSCTCTCSYASTSVSAGGAPYAGDTLVAKAKQGGRALGHQIDVQSLHSDCKPGLDQPQPTVGVPELLSFLIEGSAAGVDTAAVPAKKQPPIDAAETASADDDTNKGRRPSRDQEDAVVPASSTEGTTLGDGSTPGGGSTALLDTLRKLARACQYDDSARLTVWGSGVIQKQVLGVLSGQAPSTTPAHQAAAATLLWYLSRCQALQTLELPGSTSKLDGDMELAHALVACLDQLGAATGKDADEGAHACCMALNNICMQRPVVRTDAIQAGAVVQLATHLSSGTPKIRAAAATALLSLTWIAPEEGGEGGEEGASGDGAGGADVWDGRKAVQQLGLLPGAVQVSPEGPDIDIDIDIAGPGYSIVRPGPGLQRSGRQLLPGAVQVNSVANWATYSA
jgi:hypothetical protein